MTGDMTLDPWSGEWTDRVVTHRDRQLALWSAVDKGDLTTVRTMIDQGVDINTTDMHGNLVLHSAVIWQSAEVVKELIDAGSDVNKQNDNGQTPLHLAADKGKAYAVLQLLEGGTQSDIKTQFSEMTALHLAAKSGHHSIVRLLLDHGSDPNTGDCIGKIPEFYAANTPTKKEFENWRKQKGKTTNGDNKKSSVTARENDLSNHGNQRQSVLTEVNNNKPDSNLKSPDTSQPNNDKNDINRYSKGHSVQTNKNLKVRSPPGNNPKGELEKSNRETKSRSVHFVKDPPKSDTDRNKKVINSKQGTSQSKNINWKHEFSKEHKERMATNVFDRLAGKKK